MIKSKPILKNHKKLYIWVTSLVAAITLLCIVLFVSFAFQVPQYSYYYTKCGFRQPVKVVERGIGNDSLNYVIPADSGYESYALSVRGYFCTEADAQRAGLKSIYRDGWFNSDYTPASQVKW